MNIFSVSPKTPWLLFSVLMFISTASTQLEARKAYTKDEIRSVYLLNFLKYVTWPDRKNENFEICGAGRSEEKPYRLLSKETIKGKNITYRKVTLGDHLETCHILFLGFMSSKKRTDFIHLTSDSSVLTVSSAMDFIKLGGMIEINLNKKTKVLRINLDITRQVDLEIRSNLLDIADIVNTASAGSSDL